MIAEPNNLPPPLDNAWHLERFFALSSDLLCVIGSDGTFKAVNPAFEKALGYTQTEIIGQPLLAFVHADDHLLTRNAIGQLAAENPSVYFENRLRKQDGSYQWVGWTISYNNEGIFYAVARVVAEQQLAVESPVGYLSHLLMDAPAGMVILHGPRQIFTLVNSRYEIISGHSRAKLLNHSIRDLLPELEVNGVFQMFDHLYATGEAYVAHEFYASFDHTGQGFLQEGYYNFVAQPIKNLEGQITDVLVHVYEVTEFVRARQKLQESEEQFRAIFNQSTVGNAQTDLTGRFVLLNDRFCEIAGYSREELLQKRMHDITHPDDLPHNAQLFERMVDEGNAFIIEKRYIRKDGLIVWVRDSVSPIRDANGHIKYALAASFDVTEIKAAEQALMEHQRDQAVAEERQRLSRELHDSVTQALFSAGVITEAIPRLLESQPQKALSQLNNLGELIRGASSEMRNLLLELRSDRITQTGLAVLLTQLAYAVQARKPHEVYFKIHGEHEVLLPPPVLMAIYRIAQESINNIIKHGDAGKISMLIRQNEHYILLTVSDDGQGFDSKQIRAGFGLTIMQERADEVDVQLDIRSQAGKGTKVRIFWRNAAV